MLKQRLSSCSHIPKNALSKVPSEQLVRYAIEICRIPTYGVKDPALDTQSIRAE